jgi:hypothetical protein
MGTAGRDFEAEEGARFAANVLELYRSALDGKGHQDTDPDVRRVAFGLVALRQTVDHRMQAHRKEPLRLAAGGVYEADDILAALTAGTAHPIWKYLESLRSAGERRNRPAPGQRERSIRSMMAGAVLAYEKTGTTRKAAAIAVSEGIWTAERSFQPGQLLQWIRRDDDAVWFSGQFTADAVLVPNCDSASERILIVVREALHPLLALPR